MMKKIKTVLLCIFLSYSLSTKAQGKYAYEFSEILGQKFVTEKDIPELKNFRGEQGKILGELDENARYSSSLEVFRKGNTAVVVLEKLINPETQTKSVIEVLKLTKVLKNQEVRISGCLRKKPYPNEEIVAVVSMDSRKIKVFQAFVLKDIRFEKLNVKLVKCINEIDD